MEDEDLTLRDRYVQDSQLNVTSLPGPAAGMMLYWRKLLAKVHDDGSSGL